MKDLKERPLRGPLGLYRGFMRLYKGYIRVVLGLGVPSRGPSYCPLSLGFRLYLDPKEPTFLGFPIMLYWLKSLRR